MSRRHRSHRPRARCGCLLGAALIGSCLLAFSTHAQAKEGEIIVQLQADADIAPLLVKHQLSLMGRIGTRPIFRLKVLGKAKVNDKVAALGLEPAVRTAEPNHDYAATEPFSQNLGWAIGEPDAYAEQWALAAIRLDEAHRHTRGKGIRIAVLDSGVDMRHPALVGRLLPGFDFVDGDTDPSEEAHALSRTYGHGTHVVGLVARVAPEARIMPMRIVDAGGTSSAWVLAEAMLRAMDPDGDPATDDGAHVINLSVGTLSKTQLFKTVARLVTCKLSRGKAGVSDDSDEDDDAFTNDGESVGVTVADKARCQGFGGAVVVAAAGNRGDDKVREYPAGETSKGLLSVAASTSSGSLASFSNYGWVKLAAPGEGITSAVPGGGYGTWSGTSMASPIVAGAAALVRAANRSMAVDDVVKRLESSGSKLCGAHLAQLDVAAAVANASPPDKRSCK
jgi:subtilisin family serine protease